MSSIPTLTVETIGIPVVEAIPLEEYQRPSAPLPTTPPTRRSTKHITMAPDDPEEWPYHYLKRELIELKKTIDVLELWTWLQVEFPPEDKGFMFWDHENMNKISDKLEELYGNQHSGYTWGQSMRTIQFIAKNGFDNYKQQVEKEIREYEAKK
tara:strand:+ start:3117 stop:3575 length:459 start_codon:yes stop_codon:yes gene_type:complete